MHSTTISRPLAAGTAAAWRITAAPDAVGFFETNRQRPTEASP